MVIVVLPFVDDCKNSEMLMVTPIESNQALMSLSRNLPVKILNFIYKTFNDKYREF